VGGLILSKNKEIAEKIDKAIFPGLQGGPLQNEIAGKAVALKEAQEKKILLVIKKQVIKNAKILANEFIKNKFNLVSGGTDNHLILINLTNLIFLEKKLQKDV